MVQFMYKGDGMFEQRINIDRMEQAVALFGSFDENVKLIEQVYGVKIVGRDSEIKVSGRTGVSCKSCENH